VRPDRRRRRSHPGRPKPPKGVGVQPWAGIGISGGACRSGHQPPDAIPDPRLGHVGVPSGNPGSETPRRNAMPQAQEKCAARCMSFTASSQTCANNDSTRTNAAIYGRCRSWVHGTLEFGRDSRISLGSWNRIDGCKRACLSGSHAASGARMPERLRNMIDQYRQGWASCRR
jgi:hypothetical protein